jgi:g-D-glutamyl-meso-diaminopimelate peptidase
MRIVASYGDHFDYLSEVFQIPKALILSSNLGCHGHLLPGQSVKIPGYITYSYQVRQMDTLDKIAAEHQVNPDAIRILNRLRPFDQVIPGQLILIPKKVKSPIIDPYTPYSYEKLMYDLARLQLIYPFLFVRNVGYSVLGKNIPEVLVGTGKKKVHINAAFHANEWITTNVMMKFLNDYAIALTNNESLNNKPALSLFLQAHLSLVPMVNPDGVNLVLHGSSAAGPYRTFVNQLNKGKKSYKDWKANIRGVDLNNQYPADWHLEVPRKPSVPSPRDFPGYIPLSEPEAIAMANLTSISQFDRVVALHTQGKEFYWGYKGLEPAQSKTIANEFAKQSGYKSIQMIDSYAGYKDWFIQVWRRPGFTIELGEGVNPLPLQQFDEIYRDTLGILTASMYM